MQQNQMRLNLYIFQVFNLADFSFFLITEFIPPFLSFVFSLQGHGSVIQMYPGGGPVRAGMESFGFPSHFHDTLNEFPLCKVNALLSGTLNVDEKDRDSGKSEEQPAAPSSGGSESQSMEVSTDPAEAKKMEERERLREQRVSLSSLYCSPCMRNLQVVCTLL